MTSIHSRQKLNGRFCKAMSRNTNSIKFTYTKIMEPRAPKRRIKKKVWRKVSQIAPPKKSGTLGINCRVVIDRPTFIGRVGVEVGGFHQWQAMAYDNPIPGFDTYNTNNLRLWRACPSKDPPWLWMVVVGYVSSRMCWRSGKCYC